MAELWVHALRGNRLERSVRVPAKGLLVGSLACCDLSLKAPGIAPEHGQLLPVPDGKVRFAPSDGSPPALLAPGDHLSLGEFTLSLESRSRETPRGPSLERVLDLFPTLWREEDGAAGFDALLSTLRTAFDAQWAALLSPPTPDEPPRVLQSVGVRPGQHSDGISKTVVDELASRRGPVLVADVHADPVLSQAHSIPLEVRSVIAAPLTRGDTVQGIILLESPLSSRAYSADERDALGRVCAAAAEHLARIGEARELARANARLGGIQRADMARDNPLENLVGDGPAMRRVLEQVRQVARTDVTVLILGETGTGKELVARAIHQLSARHDSPFVAVNCMALPDDLVESELFGHVRGAFSGAQADRLGRFEMAHRGSVFLDEVGELSSRIQIKLLRALQERVIQRLGDAKDRPIDIRLVAATNADLTLLRSRGAFRDDLYYRLSVFVIQLPALRERPEDIPALADHFVRLFNRTQRRRVAGLDPRAIELLRAHAWPGNVRELRNVIEAAFVRETGDRISARSLSFAPGAVEVTAGPGEEEPDGLEAARAAFERRHILRVLEAEDGNVAAAIRRLEISRSNFYKKCSQLGIDPSRGRR